MSIWSRAMQAYLLFAHDLFRKPVSTFRDHARKKGRDLKHGAVQRAIEQDVRYRPCSLKAWGTPVSLFSSLERGNGAPGGARA
ncbi:MAG: hypothetical protein WA743_12045, partial [Pseudolabrys sp.]